MFFISFSEFLKVDIRVGTVTKADENFNLKKPSMILEIDREIKKTEITEYLSSKENIPIMQLSYDPIVSSDIKYHDSSCVVDMRWLEIMNNKLRLVTWYDNEWGYSNRVADLIRLLGNLDN